MGKIVAVGGGSLKGLDTLVFDKRSIKLVGKKRTKALFIPLACREAQISIDMFHRVYGNMLGCKTDTIYLLNNDITDKEISERILGSDLIYIGGGDTLMMMNFFRSRGIDKILREAFESDKVLTGLSAGSICWFRYGHSASRLRYESDAWNFIRVKGLGFLEGTMCPHFSSKILGVRRRRKHFPEFIKKHGGMGIAIDNNCAIEFIDDKYRVLSNESNRNAYRVFKRDKKVIVQMIT